MGVNEAFADSTRGVRGGSWSDDNVARLRSSGSTTGGFPQYDYRNFGFRVVSPVPEPGSLALLTVVSPLILRRRRV